MVESVDPVTNPYAPGAGTPPPLLAGRDRVIEAWDVVIGRAAAGNSFQPIVLSGLRGVGKTVLLLEFRAHARDAGWPIELFEARPGGDLRAQVAEALPPMIRTVNRRWRNKERAKKIGRIAASFARAVQARMVTGGFRFEVEPEPGVADSGDLETDLTELLVALGEGAQSEGARRGAAHRRAARGAAAAARARSSAPPTGSNQEALPVVIGGAGLPPVGRVLSEARSYAERLFSIRPVGALSPEDTRPAFEEPAADLGVTIEPARARPARRGVERLPVLHPDATASTCGTWPTTRRSPPTTSRWPSRGPTASSSTRSSGPATTGPRRPSAATCTPWPTSARATSRRPTSPPSSATTSPAGSRRSATGCSRRA